MRRFIIPLVLICGCSPSFFTGDTPIPPEMMAYLAPGYEEIRTIGTLEPDSWAISVDYKNSSTKGLIAFYEEFGADNGWTLIDSSEVSDTMHSLDFEQPKETLMITIFDSNPHPIRTNIFYTAYKWTHEEFDELVAQSASAKARSLIDATITSYQSLDTYVDKGESVSISEGEVWEKIDFSTAYRSNGDLHFEYKDNDDSFSSSASLTKLGDSIIVRSSFSDDSVEEDVSLAIASLYGVSSGTSGNIPEILVGVEGFTLFRLANMTLIDEKTLSPSVVCVGIQGEDYIGRRTTIWIDKQTNLIRQIEEFEDTQNYQTTTYEPSINVALSSEDFENKR